ncbi:MAG TPA: STAS domain-containing protein [Rhodocyclaceae bacterium]|nr:STAS domain-containing protein [Rhodocyclaceae bacterium]HNB76913.1 STAS domain-containing protein [Rhodocyclaceae bacterium]HNC60765.1 STAS domain-containing protein [Rhodocyclaceae bacterium]HNH97825.1 STAS domain-containing protein [Rhodocyclaceae bacterium]
MPIIDPSSFSQENSVPAVNSAGEASGDEEWTQTSSPGTRVQSSSSMAVSISMLIANFVTRWSALGLQGIDNVTIEMSRVAYLDSSALGMLLMLRDKARSTNRSVVLSGVNDAVRKVLDIANFGKLFPIS